MFSNSPVFVLDTWQGLEGSDDAPLWVAYQHNAPAFTMSRLEAIEIVRIAAQLEPSVQERCSSGAMVLQFVSFSVFSITSILTVLSAWIVRGFSR